MTTIEVQRGDVLVLTWDGAEPEGADVLAALGVSGDPAKIDIFPAAKIAPVGLDGFLAEGHGVAAPDLAAQKSRLDALSGIIVVVAARALAAGAGTITVAPPLDHIATFREEAAEIASPLPIEAESATGRLGGGRGAAGKSDARVGGMVAAAVLVFLAVFVTLFVLMGG